MGIIHYAFCHHPYVLGDDDHVTIAIEGTTCPQCISQIDEAAQQPAPADPCPRCQDSGWILNDGFVKVKCPECRGR